MAQCVSVKASSTATGTSLLLTLASTGARRSLRDRTGKSIVSIVRADPKTVFESVRQAMESAGWKRYVRPGANVSLKVNLGWDKLVPGAISAPWVVEGVIRTIRDYVGKLYLVESDADWTASLKLYREGALVASDIWAGDSTLDSVGAVTLEVKYIETLAANDNITFVLTHTATGAPDIYHLTSYATVTRLR